MQTIGSFVSGRFLDQFGAKGGFVISFLASALSYALLSQSSTLTILYMSKIPSIFQAGFLCAQLSASQVTLDGAERVEALGRLTFCYTLGSIIGPTIGGALGASGDYYYGAKVAVVGSLLSVVLTLFMPIGDFQSGDNNTSVKDKPDPDKKSNKDIPSTLSVIQIVWVFLLTKVVTGVANAMSSAVMPLILKNIYKLNEQSLGLSMSVMSAGNAVVNGFLLGPIVALFGSLNVVISYCISSMCILSLLQAMCALPSYTDIAYGGGLYEFFGLTFVLGLFQYVLSTTITGESTALVGSSSKGTLLGLEHSMFAAARVAAPQSGIAMLRSGGVSLVSCVCSAVFGFIFITWKFCNKPHRILDKDGAVVMNERKEK